MDMLYFDLQQRLFSASAAGDLPLLRELISNGVDINCRDRTGMTPFLTAVLHDCAKAARFLLHHGAELREVLDEDGSVLHIMVWIEHLPRVRQLVRSPRMVESRDGEGRSPLLLAAMRRNETIVRLLLEHDAPVDTADHDGNTALSVSAANGDIRIVELLLRNGAQVEGSAYHSRTPLQLATDDDVIALLREYGAQDQACWQRLVG
ncbi:ankyrin repeat domain-containing protein [bacterium]|nr:ankyrin repeat domain-containing protein [bacterium]